MVTKTQEKYQRHWTELAEGPIAGTRKKHLLNPGTIAIPISDVAIQLSSIHT